MAFAFSSEGLNSGTLIYDASSAILSISDLILKFFEKGILKIFALITANAVTKLACS